MYNDMEVTKGNTLFPTIKDHHYYSESKLQSTRYDASTINQSQMTVKKKKKKKVLKQKSKSLVSLIEKRQIQYPQNRKWIGKRGDLVY